MQQDTENPLGYEKESKLLINFAIPCIISMLVTALYNIVDQIFIGQGWECWEMRPQTLHFRSPPPVPRLPFLGIGGASNFSLKLGAGEEREAAKYSGNALTLILIFGICLFAVTEIF